MDQDTTAKHSPWEKTCAITKETQALYPDMPWLTSTEFLEMKAKNEISFVLVDIREDVEREFSIIPGSISLQDFEANAKELIANNDKIVIHCTWAFRSGYEARRIRNQYCSDSSSDDSSSSYSSSKICHLDGIVAYTFAPNSKLVDLETQQQTRTEVHTIQKQWGHPADGYTAVYFEGWELFWRTFVVMSTKGVRDFQNWMHNNTKSCRGS